MADRRNNDDRRKVNINDDYIELLNSVKIDDDEYEDIYSYSSSEDIYSDSSKDVYIGKKKRQEPEDVYIRKQPRRRQVSFDDDIYEGDIFEEEEQPRRPVPPMAKPSQQTGQVKRVRNLDSDEISDFEARHGKGKKKKRSPAFIAVAVILALVIGLGLFVSTTVSSVVGNFKKGEEIEHIENVSSLASSPNVRNILLIGADAAKGGASRADSIMIASVNKNTGRITVVSVLRDTHLDIPDYREAKVNAAYSRGGANLLIQTIEQNFGIKIDDYAAVDFNMFTALVDGLGGIDIEVTEKEANYINNVHKYGKEKKPEEVPYGENVHLTGYQALWYARIRKLDSDFMRTQRQRKVISAIMSGVTQNLTPVGIFELIGTAKDVAPYIETTLSTADCWGLVFSLASCFLKSGGDMDKMLVSEKIPFDDTWHYSSEWDGSSISINKEENKEMLYKVLYADDYEPETEEEK